jgi:hypothetical protein
MPVQSSSVLEIIELSNETVSGCDIFHVKLVSNGTESIQTLHVPLEDFRKDFSWYFDKYAVNSPYDASLAEDIETRITISHSHIFENLELAKYDQEGGSDSILWIDIIDSGSPRSRFHQIHWECLEQRTSEHWKSWETVVVRRKIIGNFAETVAVPEGKANFNILLVVARKDGSEGFGVGSDIAYHNVAKPIVDAVGTAPFLNIYLSRPGTFGAFQEHIESKPAGFYDIIHFDLHGKLQGEGAE